MALPSPHLPTPTKTYSWRDLAEWRENQGPELYLACLEYAQQLWMGDLPARALLAVDRALYCEVPAGHAVLTKHPYPYAVIAWMVKQPTEEFTGNARVHYQHLADRVRGPKSEIKKWRAWAAWAVVCQHRPDLSSDPLHEVTPPTLEEITEGLNTWSIQNEVDVWQAAMKRLT